MRCRRAVLRNALVLLSFAWSSRGGDGPPRTRPPIGWRHCVLHRTDPRFHFSISDQSITFLNGLKLIQFYPLIWILNFIFIHNNRILHIHINRTDNNLMDIRFYFRRIWMEFKVIYVWCPCPSVRLPVCSDWQPAFAHLYLLISIFVSLSHWYIFHNLKEVYDE